MSGYQAFHSDRGEKSTVTTLVKRNIAVIEHELDLREIENVFVEILTGKKTEPSLFLLNIYSSPKQRKVRFRALLRKTLKISGNRPLVVVGDFNAHHQAWGYSHQCPKGRQLWEDMQDQGLSLHTDPDSPTRVGNSVSVDTSPDLTLSKNVRGLEWHNSELNFGSDHYILVSLLKEGLKTRRARAPATVEWDQFRTIRSNQEGKPICDIGEWAEQLKSNVGEVTKTLEGEDAPEIADSRLLHMWEAKQSMERRLRTQKWNRTLRRRLARHNKEIEDYSFKLCEQNWGNKCDQMEGEMNLARTWGMLRHLLDPENSKTQSGIRLAKARQAFDGGDDDFMQKLIENYVGETHQTPLPDYDGAHNEALDAPITEAEVRAELVRLRTKSAPGPDGITNKMLRNLDDTSIGYLTEYMQECWDKGELPQQWKSANVILIPKPGKPPQLGNLRPISLTSCIGKLMEHVIQTRLIEYLEKQDLLPHTMIGFRPHLCTQDIMLQIKHDIVDSRSKDAKVILGLDLTKAFDNVKHEAILTGLSNLNVGTKTFNYVRNFLSGRTACVKFQSIESSILELGSRGTPQGSVLSPLLFNVAMCALPGQLERIEGLQFSLYADDITLWVNQGSDSEIEQRLQAATDTIVRYAAERGLACSPQKSELFVYNPKHLRCKAPSDILIQVAGAEVPKVEQIRILGLVLQSHGHNGETLKRLESHVMQTLSLIRRVASKGRGLKEKNLMRLVQAFIFSRVSYSTPYLDLKSAEKMKIDGLIRRCVKRALGLPTCTSTERLLALGMHNTWVELAEAVRTSQIERLCATKTGRTILAKVGINPHRGPILKAEIKEGIRSWLTIPPLPKNMHPEHNKIRREKRAEAISLRYRELPSEQVAYVDAACGHDGRAVAAVVDGRGNAVTAVSLRTRSAAVAEEVAVALACVGTEANFIISDSKTAIQNFSAGRISPAAAKILDQRQIARKITLIWTPAHASVPGNEAAHELARGLYHRAGEDPLWQGSGERMVKYGEITQHYRLERRLVPPPDPSLNNTQAVAWRRLQTYTYPHPILVNHMFPDIRSDECTHCGLRGSLDHIIWECSNSPGRALNIASKESWETLLRSSDPELQLRLVRLAEEAAGTQDLLASI